MTQASEQIAKQFANGSINMRTWGNLLYNVRVFGAAGDGITDDTIPIRLALAAAKETGGTVKFPDGTYRITDILYVGSNVTIELGNAILKRGSSVNAMIINDSNGTVGGYGANTNIAIIGGTIDGNISSYPSVCTLVVFGHSQDIVIDSVKFKDCPGGWHHVELNGVKNANIKNCTFDGYAASGTEMLQIDLMYDAGTFPWFGPYDNTPCSQILINECKFSNGIDGIGTHSGAVGVRHENVHVVGCDFSNLTGVSIKPLDYHYFKVERSVFNNVWKGIYATAGNICDGMNIVDNIFNNITNGAGGRAIQIATNYQRGVIERNQVNTCGSHGIGIDLNTDWVVRDNTVTNCGLAGFWSYGSDHVKVENNTLIGNNTTATALRYDLMIGVNQADVSQYNIVRGNRAGTSIIDYGNNTIFTENVITSINEPGTSTGTRKFNNYINSVWTP